MAASVSRARNRSSEGWVFWDSRVGAEALHTHHAEDAAHHAHPLLVDLLVIPVALRRKPNSGVPKIFSLPSRTLQIFPLLLCSLVLAR